MDTFVLITQDPIQSQKMREFISTPKAGAIVQFEGVIRDHDEGVEVHSIEYEIYEAMAQKEMEKIAQEMRSKWPISKVAMVHRKGNVKVGETSVIVAVSSAHRKEAFEAAQFGIDEIKRRAPIWKKEETNVGKKWKERKHGS